MKKVTLLLVLFICTFSFANNDKYRLILNSDPATTIMIAWNQTSGSNPVVYYDTVDHGDTDHTLYSYSKTVDRSTSYKGMENQFASLTGLTPDTNYYFIIHDSEGNSQRFWFKTAPDDLSRLSFIAGGDSRNNRTPRQAANTLVSKLKPHAVLFGGDMTNSSTDAEWQNWFDDWQLTTASNGRMFPIVPARGNHENTNNVYNLFNTTSDSDSYYALTFGDNLYRIYTLNSEISVSGNQLTWLQNDLEANTNIIWKSAQYHKPMRPHYTGKSEGDAQYNAWSQLFYDNGVRLVMESDTHTVKTTWPLEPSSEPGNDMGFIRNDINGTVYVGEGCWGAPTRAADDEKDWTRNMGQFNQFKLIWVSTTEIEVRTIDVDNAADVGENTDNNPFNLPSNLDVWNPSEGDVVTILPAAVPSYPSIEFTPGTETSYTDGTNLSIGVDVLNEGEGITKVDFYINGSLTDTDTTNPYSFTENYTDGNYIIEAIATASDGETSSTAQIIINVGNFSVSNQYEEITDGNDDIEENGIDQSVYFTSSDLELVYDNTGTGNQKIGLRFQNINIPQGATITDAYIQFMSDGTWNNTDAEYDITIEDSYNSDAFEDNGNANLTGRTFSNTIVDWNPETWAEDEIVQSPQLNTLLQEITNKREWNQGNNVVFQIVADGESETDTDAKRRAESYEGNYAPRIYYSYTYNAIIETVSDTASINNGNDDVEETEAGRVYFTSSDLEMVYDSHQQFDNVANGYQKIGLRFQDIEIPFGAELTSAYIQFSSDRDNATNAEFLIFSENSGNAPAFEDNTNYNVSARNKIATSVSWSPGAWTNNQKDLGQRTPDLSNMLQNVLDRCNWRSGNSMVIIIEGNGDSLTDPDSKRVGDSFEEGGSNAPKLIYTYTYNTSIDHNNETEFTGLTWSNGVPTSDSVAIISQDYDTSINGNINACTCEVETNKQLKVTANNFINIKSDIIVNGSLIVEDKGSVVQEESNGLVTNNGSIIVEKITTPLTDRGFTILGSPMSNDTREGVYNSAAMVRYHDTDLFNPNINVENNFPLAENFADDNGNNWISHTGKLNPAEGYLVKPFAIGETGGTYTTTYTQGTLNNGTINFQTKYGDDQNDSPNILANPYPSAIDAYEFVNNNPIVDAIYYWEHISEPNNSYPGYNASNYDMGDISMYNLSGGTAAANNGPGSQATNQYIPSGQGFAIKANAAGTVTFNNAMRINGNNSGYRNSESDIERLYLNVINNTYNLKSGTLIAFTENATDDFDTNYDAKRLATPVSLYSLIDGYEFGIQGRSAFNNSHIIPLGFSSQVEEEQEYIISINDIEGELISNSMIILKDNLTNTVTNLLETDYRFTSNAGDQTNRFVIVFNEQVLNTTEFDSNSISIYPNPTQNILNINSSLEEMNSIELYDLRGRLVNKFNIDYQVQAQIDISTLENAMYFIKINTENGSTTKRIIKK